MIDIETRLARAESRWAIETALNSYVFGIDGRDSARWLDAFHEDSTYEVGFPEASVQGHDAILEWVREPWRFKTISHMTGNHQIDVLDDEHGTGRCRGIGIFKLEDGAVMLATAAIEDRYLKRNDRWRIAFRKVSIISSFQLTGAVDLILNGVPVVSSSLI